MAYIILHWDLGWVELCMVGTPAWLVDEAAGDSVHEEGIIDGELNHRIQLPTATIQQLIKLQCQKKVRVSALQYAFNN